MPVNDTICSSNWDRFQWCTQRGHYNFLEKADRCENFFAGLQWDQADLDSLKLQKRPALTINKIISTIQTVQGEQIYNRNEVLYRPAAGASADTADILSKVWMEIAQSNQLQWVRSDLFADGIIRSRGFYDVRMAFGDNMQGKVIITNLNSKNCVIDPDADSYDPDDWNDLFITKWMTPLDIELLYNAEDAKYLASRDGSLFPYAYDSIERVRDRFAGAHLLGNPYGTLDKDHLRRTVRVLERQFRVISSQQFFVDTQTGDTRPVPDAWDRNRIAAVMEKTGNEMNIIKKKVKRIKWQVQADHVLLHDDWSPYKHFTWFPSSRSSATARLSASSSTSSGRRRCSTRCRARSCMWSTPRRTAAGRSRRTASST